MGATPPKPSLLAGPAIIEIEDNSPEGYKPELAPPPPEVLEDILRGKGDA